MALIPKNIVAGAAAGLAGKAIASLFSKNSAAGTANNAPTPVGTKREAADFRARLNIKPNDYDKITEFTKDNTEDLRVAFSSQEQIIGPKNTENILNPLWKTLGVLFPYTPTIQFGFNANYSEMSFNHTNYKQWAYVNSFPSTISMTALFTAQTESEAKYLLAVYHFLNTVTKMYYGRTPVDKIGTPPPVLLFSYLGDYAFNNTPVVITAVNFTFDNNVNYVPVYLGESKDIVTYMPTEMTFNITMEVQQNPHMLSQEFDLDKFREGKLLGKGYI